MQNNNEELITLFIAVFNTMIGLTNFNENKTQQDNQMKLENKLDEIIRLLKGSEDID